MDPAGAKMAVLYPSDIDSGRITGVCLQGMLSETSETSVTLPSNEKPFPPAGWLTRHEAAKRLKLSESRVFGMAEAGHIKTRKAKSPLSNQTVSLFSAGDIERIAFSREQPEDAAKFGPPNGTINVPATSQEPDTLTELFHKTGLLSVRGLPKLELQPDVRKPWVTVGEAAEYTGLPFSTIMHLIKDLRLPVLDCGPRAGGRFRVKRSDLDALEGRKYGE